MQKTAFGSGTALAFSHCPPKRYRGLTKTLLVMKLTIFFTAIVFFQVQAANSLAQTVTISGKDLSLKQVFAAIEKQTDFVLLNTKGTLENTKPVSLTVHKMPLKEFLDFVLKDELLEYEIHGNTILLSKKAAVTPKSSAGIIQLFPESNLITGQVINEEGYSLSGVSIFVRKANRGTYTNALGKFSIQANYGDTLVFSFVGYAEQHLKITTNELLVRMKVAHSVMDETKVTAYGKTSKRLATGHITTIKAEEITKQPIFNPLQALVGRVPGVSVLPTSGNLAAPMEVVIRGRNNINPNSNNDPLYVIDGLPLSNINIHINKNDVTTGMGPLQGGATHTRGESPLNRINPNDIESITILQDADATAIYGSRGANGVILITTKKGKVGPPAVNVRIQNGFNTVQKYPKLLGIKEYLAVRREAFLNDGIKPDRNNAPDLVSWDTTRNKNWQKELIGTGVSSDIYASVSGGTGLSTYMVSAGHSSTTTLMNAGAKNNRTSFQSSFGYSSPDRKFSFRVGNMLSLTNVHAIAAKDPSELPPNAPDIYTSNGDFNWEPYRINTGSLFKFNSLKEKSESKTLSVQSTVALDYKIIDGLSVGLQGSYAFDHNDNVSKTPESSFDPKFFTYSNAIYGNSKTKNWQVQSNISYRTFIGKGSLTLQQVSEYASVVMGSQTMFALGFPNDDMMKSYNNAMAITPTEAYMETKILKFTGIVNYNWSNRVMVTLTGTRDGSSNFGKGQRFGTFGSMGIGWNIHEEYWSKSILPSWISSMKLRGSYGLTGQSSIPPYEYLSRWSRNGVLVSAPLQQYNGVLSFHVIKPLNQQFQWVTTRSAELALELGLFKDRVQVEVAVYRKSSTDQLATQPVPIYTGFKEVLTNTPTHLRNSGITINVAADIINSSNWKLSTYFNISGNRNKLIDFPNLEYSSYLNKLRVGYSTTTQFLLRYTGINPLTGNYSFEDHNKDGKISFGSYAFPGSDLDDRYIAIETAEKYSGGFGFTLSYKQVSLHTQFDFVNRWRTDPYLRVVVGNMRNIAIPKELLENHWQQPGDIAKYPRFTTGSNDGSTLASSTGAYVNGSYLRLNGINLSWSIPAGITKKAGISNASVGVSSSNFFTLTSYKGLDPMVNDPVSAAPVARVISTFLNINF